MEGITEGVNKMKIAEFQKKNRIQVSNTKKPLFFYVNLTKRYLQQHDEVELSALGMGNYIRFLLINMMLKQAYVMLVRFAMPCFTYPKPLRMLERDVIDIDNNRVSKWSYYYETISTVVSIAEILKNNGFVVEKKIMTSTVEIKDDGSRGRPVQKAKIEIVLGKTANFDELMAAAAQEGRENGNNENGED
ncbi:hypothetical protein F511_38746 [Dorcoceras hygrometricum]|uniref:Alba DNA/RNA-binding protein n=1 Tax=Dorcoceras hygrometricum TaxID=472368 RepID=A0A2Z7D9D6_9LAMI|nr:hypothetical protein F511_38746 [Dorcoceras hygrometricum]